MMLFFIDGFKGEGVGGRLFYYYYYYFGGEDHDECCIGVQYVMRHGAKASSTPTTMAMCNRDRLSCVLDVTCYRPY